MNFIVRTGLGLCIAALCLNVFADEAQIKCLPDNQADLFIPAGYKARLPNGYFTSVKIPGMEEQVKDAFASGKQYWQGVGPGYINVPMNIYVNGERILVQTDWGLNESLDGGKSWRTISCTMFGGISHWSQYDFDVSPKDPNLIVVCGRQIYRTIDSGKTWAEVRRGTPEPPMLTGLLLPHFTKIKFNCDGSRIFTGIENSTPTTSTATTQPTPVGSVSVSCGIRNLNHTPSAVADTVIIAPANTVNMTPLAVL